jgi:FKBP-type peptidyl-prolyl cis-trans isomerase FkpA
MTKLPNQPLVATLLVLVLAAACGGGNPLDPSQNLNVAYSQSDLVVGTGRVAANGNRVTAHYTLWLYNPNTADNKGSQIESSVGGNPFTFTLGAGQVIRGWDQGVAGMAVGGKRRLVIPPSLAYGGQGSPPEIPSNATLVFELEAVGVTD